jgi:hypothetical protein
MSEPSFVVLPVSGSGPHPDQKTSEIASTVQQALYERSHPESEHPGPFKQILAHPDSLYKYINWEDPPRTLAVYLGAASILFGVHYLPLTQMALKAGVTTLGVVSVTEFASRSFSGNSLSTRLRPKEYKKISEPTLNATLKDIHDLIQYTVVQAQKIVFGQDLYKTFATFLGSFALFWLTKMISPFWLTFMALTSVFIIPLISSEQGRRAAYDASVRAQELANVAADKSREFGHDGRVKAAELSSKGKETAANLSTQATDTASDMSEKTSELSSNGKQTVADLSAQARSTVSDMSGTATENIKKLPQMGTNVVNETEDIVSSDYGNAKRYISNPPAPSSNHTNGQFRGNRSVTNGASNEVSHLWNIVSETTKQTPPGINTSKQPDSNQREYPVSSLPAYTTNMTIETANRTAPGVHNGRQPDLVQPQHPVSYLPASRVV